MNNGHENRRSSDLNGKSYHRDRGFASAAAGRGIPEAIREHINVIVRNEELETASSHEQNREEIQTLQGKKGELEQEKDSCQKEIRAREVEVAQQDATLAELKAKLDAPPEVEVMSSIKFPCW